MGNNPSQTKVKVESCVPIDVTELQDKIENLEQQLQAINTYKQTSRSIASKSRSLIQYALQISKSKISHSKTRKSSINFWKAITNKNRNKSKTVNKSSSLAVPLRSLINLSQVLKSQNLNTKSISDIISKDVVNYKNTIDNSLRVKNNKKHKKKNTRKKNKENTTHFVYLTQTAKSSLNSYTRTLDPTFKRFYENHIMRRSLLSHIAKKQYTYEPILCYNNAGSELSAPTCRDEDFYYNISHADESDMCSCCHGKFHNIDRDSHQAPTQTYNQPISSTSTCNILQAKTDKNVCYTSSLYDIVPVKDIPFEVKGDTDKIKKIQSNALSELSLENIWRNKTRIEPITVNHNTTILPNYEYDNLQRNAEMKTEFSTNEIRRRKQRAANQSQSHRIRLNDNVNTQKNQRREAIDFEVIFSKPHTKTKTDNVMQSKIISYRDAECLTTHIKSKQCQTITSEVHLESVPTELNNAHTAVSDIKELLNTVLAEIKISCKLNDGSGGTSKTKDAGANELAQSSLHSSMRFMQNYSCNPFMYPYPYMAPFPPPSIAGHLCYATLPYVPLKRTQNFPLLIPPPDCISNHFYRNPVHITSTLQPKNSANVTTNTEISLKDKHRQEAEKLIKEIYKSISIDLHIPAKDLFTDDYELESNVKSNSDTKNTFMSKMYVNLSDKINVQENVSYIGNHKDATTLTSNTNMNKVKSRSQYKITSTQLQLLKPVMKRNSQQHSLDDRITDHNPKTEINHTSDAGDTSDDITLIKGGNVCVINPNRVIESGAMKMEKKGLIKKVFTTVRRISQCKGKVENAGAPIYMRYDPESGGNETDDFETICTEKSRFILAPRQQRKQRKKEPYMEPEFRRDWEQTFHKNESVVPKGRTVARNFQSTSSTARAYAFGDSQIKSNGIYVRVDPYSAKSKTDSNSKIASMGWLWRKKNKLQGIVE